MKRRRALASACVALLVSAAAAWAFSSGATGSGLAASQQMPAGATPEVEVAGQDVTLRWSPSTFADGTGAESYLVRRFDAQGAERTVGAGCAGAQPGPSCTEREVPEGTWSYTVTPRYRSWTGAESGPSAPVTVDTITPTLVALDMLDRDLDGKVDAVEARFSEPLAPYGAGTQPWRLAEVPSDGTLGGVAVEGSVAVLTIDEGPLVPDTAVGAFTVALDPHPAGIRDAGGNLVSFPPTAPADRSAPISIGLRDANVPGGTDGRMEAGDRLVVVFSEDLVDASIPLLTSATEADPAGQGNDTLAIEGISAGAIDTGSDGYVDPDGASATATSVSVEFGKGTHVLTVVILAPCVPPLGEDGCDAVLGAGGPGPVTFRPAPSLRDAAGNPAAGSIAADLRLF